MLGTPVSSDLRGYFDPGFPFRHCQNFKHLSPYKQDISFVLVVYYPKASRVDTFQDFLIA